MAEERAPPRPFPDWRWRTFPVFFAFAVGALAMALLTALAPWAFPAFLIAAVFLLAFGLAHVATRVLIARRRR